MSCYHTLADSSHLVLQSSILAPLSELPASLGQETLLRSFCYTQPSLAGGLLHDCVCALPWLRAVCLELTSADGACLHACRRRQD